MAMTLWQLSAHHEFQDKALEKYSSLNKIAIGWAYSGDLRIIKPHDKYSIENAILKNVPDKENAAMGGESLWKFYNEMKEGDLVIVTAMKKQNKVFKVTGNYFFSDDNENILNYQHQRNADLTDLDGEKLLLEAGHVTIEENENTAALFRVNSDKNINF